MHEKLIFSSLFFIFNQRSNSSHISPILFSAISIRFCYSIKIWIAADSRISCYRRERILLVITIVHRWIAHTYPRNRQFWSNSLINRITMNFTTRKTAPIFVITPRFEAIDRHLRLTRPNFNAKADRPRNHASLRSRALVTKLVSLPTLSVSKTEF